MKELKLKTAVTALAAAIIWGTAFAFQRMAAGDIGAFSFTFYRSALASLSLGVPLLAQKMRQNKDDQKKADKKQLALGGLVCGVLIMTASTLQQAGLANTEAGKAGFLTALYILLVPILSVVFLRKKVAPSLWICVLLGLIGLYFISVKDGFTISGSDTLILLSSLVYAVYILAVAHYVRFCSPTALNCAQFGVSAVICLPLMFIFEEPTVASLLNNIIPILYLGIFSSALAYTLQFIAQRNGNTVAVTLILSMESVFSAVGGAVLLHEFLTSRELFGCALMFTAVILIQLPERVWKRKKTPADK